MKSKYRNIAIGALVAVPLVVGGSFAYYWFSEGQQLKRACWEATKKALVSPATSSLIDYRFELNGSRTSPIAMKLNKELQDARIAMEAADKASDEAAALTQSIFDKEMAQFKAATGVDSSLPDKYTEAARLRDKIKAEAARTNTVWNTLNNKVRIYKESGVPEIVLDLDSQNRAGALLRSEAVCQYRWGADEIESVALVQLESR